MVSHKKRAIYVISLVYAITPGLGKVIRPNSKAKFWHMFSGGPPVLGLPLEPKNVPTVISCCYRDRRVCKPSRTRSPCGTAHCPHAYMKSDIESHRVNHSGEIGVCAACVIVTHRTQHSQKTWQLCYFSGICYNSRPRESPDA